MQKILTLILFSLLARAVLAQDKSNRGKEFWLGYGFNYKFTNEPPVNDQELALYISTEAAATVTITINGTGYNQTLNIPANTVDASILIPKTGADDARILTDGLSAKGIHIVSTVPIAVYAHCYGPLVSGATMLMPVDTYGLLYYSINYSQATSGSQLPAISPTTQNGPDWYSWFYVIASENNTRLLITPSDTTKNGWLPGQSYTVNLNKGEVYNVFGKLIAGNNAAYAASKDMTGSKVLSVAGADGNCHPVALFSGSSGLRLCRGDGGEFVHQQVFPAQAWGTRYLTYHTINNATTNINETNRNYYRVCVQNPSTIVKRNGVILTGITNNFYYEFQDSTGGDYITADKPILVAQYTPNKNQCWNFPTTTPSPPSYGDPEMFYLSPIEQGQKSVLFYVSRKSTIDYVYANIHFPTAAVGSLLVDGAAVPSSQIRVHPNLPTYSVAVVRFIGAAAQHRIICDSSFTSTVYGLGNYESYGYNVGTLINNLNALSQIANTLNSNGLTDTFTCPKTPVRLYVKTAYKATSIKWQLSQAGGGMMPNVDSVINNPMPVDSNLVNGRRYYNYSLQQDFTFATNGTYYIPVVYTSPEIDNCNNSDTSKIQVVVKPGPIADFSSNMVNCIQDTAFFTGTSSAGIFMLDRYKWTFDDGTTQATLNAKKKFNTGGNHPVNYQIIATNGCVADTTKTLNFLGSPVAKFGFSGNICVADSVNLSDSSTIATGSIASWQWDFGDGSTAVFTNGNPFFHTYNMAGSFTVTLVTASASGCSSNIFTAIITVSPKPKAKFGYDKNICVNDSIQFRDSSSISMGIITQWKWDFGDGINLIRTNNAPFFHPYTIAGNYTVTLVVTPNIGCTDTAKLMVSVSQKPVANFSVSGSPCVDSVLRFMPTSSAGSGSLQTWYWNFGNGQTLTNTNANTASTTYTSTANSIIVKHVVATNSGCLSDTAYSVPIAIFKNPIANFSIVGDTFCQNKNLSFLSLNNAADSITKWAWSFGDGSSAATNTVQKNYNTAGSFNVQLIIKNKQGCGSLPISKPLTIFKTPIVDAGPSFAVFSGSTVQFSPTVNDTLAFSFNWTPFGSGLSNYTILRPMFTVFQNQIFTLTASGMGNCIASDSMQVKVLTPLKIVNAFSPNGDGVNDTWILPGLEDYVDATIQIFDRYGRLVFESKQNPKPWDGKLKGTLLPVGTYYYIIDTKTAFVKPFTGSLVLLK